MKTNTIKKWLKRTAWVIASPIILFMILVVLLYIPPIQNFVVGKVTESLSASTGKHISVGYVRLAFPLDLNVHEVCITEGKDTLLSADRIYLDVKLLPLLSGRAEVNAFELNRVTLNTKNMISDLSIRGKVGHLEAKSRGIEWGKGNVWLDRAALDDARLYVTMSDTAQEAADTTPGMPWHILSDDMVIRRTSVFLSMPGDTLRISAGMELAKLEKGDFDTGKTHYHIGSFLLKKGSIRYAAKSSPAAEKKAEKPFQGQTGKEGQTPDFLWKDFQPAKGIDPSCIALSDVETRIDSLDYNDGILKLTLAELALKERSGIEITEGKGRFYMDSLRMQIPQLDVSMPDSRMRVKADIPFHALETGGGGVMNVSLTSSLSGNDLADALQEVLPEKTIAGISQGKMDMTLSLTGNMDRLSLQEIGLGIPGKMKMRLSGRGQHLLAEDREMVVSMEARVSDGRFLKSLLPDELSSGFNLPDGLTAQGKITVRGAEYGTDLRIGARSGVLNARAKANTDTENYTLSARANVFPVSAFLPASGLGPFSGKLDISGRGFDVTGTPSRLMATAQVKDFRAGNNDLGGIDLKARKAGRQAQADLNIRNTLAEVQGTLTAQLEKRIDAQLHIDMDHLDISRLAGMKDTLMLGTNADFSFYTDRKFSTYGIEGGLKNIRYLTPRMSIPAKNLYLDLSASPDTTAAHISAGDLKLSLHAQNAPEQIGGGFGKLVEVFSAQIADKAIDLEALKQTLPVMDISMEAGKNNPLSKILHHKGITYRTADITLKTSPDEGLGGHAEFGNLSNGSIVFDTIHARLLQDTAGVHLMTHIRNYTKKNPAKFSADLSAFILKSAIGAHIDFFDHTGRKGIDLGLRAAVAEGGMQVSLYPENPVIAYRNFKINGDNYLYLGRNKEIRADIDLTADDGTGLNLFSQPSDSINDLTLSLHQLNLGELSDVMPFMPRIAGMLSGDLHVMAGREEPSFSAAASFNTESLKYEDALLGNVGMEAYYLPKEGGEHYANGYIFSDDKEVMQCEGTYKEDTFDGRADISELPLQMVNGFLSGTDMALNGYVKGQLSIHSGPDTTEMNGELSFDSAHLYSDVYGFNFAMDEKPIVMEKSRMMFDSFSLLSNGSGNPLVLDGCLDMGDPSGMWMDFRMKAQDFELVNTKKKSGSLLFGKVYADFIGSLKGTADEMTIKGKLDILERTDMTYILKDSPLTVDDRLHDLVKFVDFSDTAHVEEPAIVEPGGFNMILGISIRDAAQFNCSLSDDGSNYVKVEGGGDLTMRITPQGDLRLNGRITANSGEMKYSLPVIPLKTFHIVSGSYVEFTGDVANPTLNISAKERMRTTVTENDVPRAVNFDVGVAITQPLDQMGLAFTIEAPEDLNVQNQLAAMSPDQRNKTAVAMLATGMFVTDDFFSSSGSGFKASNALNAFLQSEIQSIAGTALRTFDISVGVENNTSESGTETTDYSFQFAKRFWNNRISVIVGGKVSTGEDADNSAASFIDNVTIEYRLDRSATRYVKVFYDRSAHDPLEGQLTQTGAGLVLRRKTDKLGELFLFRRKK